MSIDTLIARWRQLAKQRRTSQYGLDYAKALDACADELEAIADQLSACRTAEAVAHRWSRDGVPTGGWIDGIPSQRQFEAQVQCKDLANWTVEYAYAHPAKAVPEGER